jgi:MFS family permease
VFPAAFAPAAGHTRLMPSATRDARASSVPAGLPEADAEADAGLWSPSRRGLTLGLVLTITLVAAEGLAVGTAMPVVARDLGGLELYGLVFSAFFVGSLLGIVIVGALIDRLGVVEPFVGGLVFFAIGLTIAGLSPSMPVLILARFIQGIGGGAVPPIAYVAIGRTLPEALRPRMFAILSAAWVLPGIFGPAIAGIVVETFHWRFVFLGLLPLILVSGTMATRALIELPSAVDPVPTSLRSRLGEAVLVAAGVALLTAGLTSDSLLVLIALAVPGIILTFVAFRRLTPPGTLRLARGYPTAVLLRGVLTFAFFCVDAYVGLLLVQVRGWSPTAAGIALTAATVSWSVGSWLQSRLAGRFTPEQFARIGFPIVALGIAGLGLVVFPAIPAAVGIVTFAIAGLGMGLAYSQFALIVLRDVPPDSQGRVTAGLTLSDVLGTAVGTGVVAAVVAASVRSGAGPAPGIGIGIAIGSALAVVGFLVSPRLTRGPRATVG